MLLVDWQWPCSPLSDFGAPVAAIQLEVIFLCRRQAGDLIALLEQEFQVLVLPEQSLAVRWVGWSRVVRSLARCSQTKDAADCLSAIDSAEITSADWIVVDHYGLDAIWEGKMLDSLAGDKHIYKLLAIDDLADRPHEADLLLDQNFFGAATEQRYQGLLPSHCRQLLGPHYALLGPEYAQLHPLVPERTELLRCWCSSAGNPGISRVWRLALLILSWLIWQWMWFRPSVTPFADGVGSGRPAALYNVA